MNALLVLTLLACSVSFAIGAATKPCQNLAGKWYNEMGTNLTVLNYNQQPFSGYLEPYIKSAEPTNVSGVVQTVKGGSLVSLSVMFKKEGPSLAWVGECIVCDQEEVIFGTWVLRYYRAPAQMFNSTTIQVDTFRRIENDKSDLQNMDWPATCNKTADLIGDWKSPTGDSFDISCVVDKKGFRDVGAIIGKHPKSMKSKKSSTYPIYGIYFDYSSKSAVGFAGVESKSTIRGWAGQIVNAKAANSEFMETSWLEHQFYNSCEDPRRFVYFGMDNYTQSAS